VRVHLRIENNPGIATMYLRVDFAEELTLANVIFPNEVWHFERNDGLDGNYTVLSLDTWQNVTRDGILFTLVFEVCANMQTNTQLEITAANDLNIRMEYGEVRVQPMTTLGDTAAVGRVTSGSATKLARYLIGENVIIDLRAADVNCDDYVNMSDITHLLGALVGRHALGCKDGCVHH
jgi:hypothetical protein